MPGVRIIKNFGASRTYTFRKQRKQMSRRAERGGKEKEYEGENERAWKRERVLRFYIRAGRSVTGPIIYPRSFPVSNFHHHPRPAIAVAHTPPPTSKTHPPTAASPRCHRCLLISVKMFSLHSQVKLKFSPSLALHPTYRSFSKPFLK